MAAYASLFSLMTLIDQIQNHPSPPITLHKGQVEFLCHKITFLQGFLEAYSHNAIEAVADADGLESRIANVAYAAADVIESHIADQIQYGMVDYEAFYHDMHKVIEGTSSVVEEVMEIKEKLQKQGCLFQKQLIRDSSERPRSVGKKKTAMVGFDGVFEDVFHKLTGDQSSLQIIPIVGMGGIGKTTLARDVYENKVVVQHFDIRAWVVVSQDYNVRDIFLRVLLDLNVTETEELLSQMSGEELGQKLYQSLYDRRYLVVLDDLWNVEVWDEIRRFFCDNNNRSRIITTTRLSYVASELSKDEIVMEFLDENQSWNLLCNVVFGEETCPAQLEEIGRKIAIHCKGLPLSIIVMGGLLANSKQTPEDWSYFADKLDSSTNLEYEQHCLQILQTSLDHLPIHLKPCFLYMGVFPEDATIKVSRLIKVWVAEGFVKPIYGKTLELIAEEYLMDLIDRNLISVESEGFVRKVNACRIHDVMRELCIKIGERERFLWIARKDNIGIQQGINVQRRTVVNQSTLKNKHASEVVDALQSASLVHSVICDATILSPQLPSRMLRIWNVAGNRDLDSREGTLFLSNTIWQSINLRFLASTQKIPLRSISISYLTCQVPSSIHLLWNLQTLILHCDFLASIEIWRMHQLKHVDVRLFSLSDPPQGVGDYEHVLSNLQTLSLVRDFRCSDKVVKRIPNIKKLKIRVANSLETFSKDCLGNLGRLQKLESLSCFFRHGSRASGSDSVLWDFAFPCSLAKLELVDAGLHWEDVTTKIGSLPHLQVLKLERGIQGCEWNLVEGKFQRLKLLKLYGTDLEDWRVESNSFPCLLCLRLWFLKALKEIPTEIGDAPQLRQIMLYRSCDSALNSAQKIIEEQEELGNDVLRVYNWDSLFDRYVQLRPTNYST